MGNNKFSTRNSVCYTELISLLKRPLNGPGTELTRKEQSTVIGGKFWNLAPERPERIRGPTKNQF